METLTEKIPPTAEDNHFARQIAGTLPLPNVQVVVRFTLEEAQALDFIIGNGWGNGDFAGYGGSDIPTQKRAMRKLSSAIAKVHRKEQKKWKH